MPHVANPSNILAVRVWLSAVAALIFLTLVVGGATRLTESGLSITEWKPVTGVMPPISGNEWQAEFDKYKLIPQYRELNRGMTLAEFKTIYWWEWTHRLLARLVGAAFLLPFLYFLWRRMIPGALQWRLWSIFGAGALLGGVGWWMVSSGLSERTSVSQYRLAFHLTLACAIYGAIVWTAQRLDTRAALDSSRRLRVVATALMLLVLFQIYLGALVAGLDAGLTLNTWPLIDGAFIPSAERMWFVAPPWRNLFENALTVQFDHRMVAYTVWIVTLLHAIDAWRSGDNAVKTRGIFLAVLVTLQATLGIATLLFVAPLHLALAHQAFAIVVLTVAVVHAARTSDRGREMFAGEPAQQGAQ
ncbi:MAG: COX15/CtaA family protein [Pseudolabrys sp.]|nr:COX15/CtaA family protein [Pseudolabrys sp.]